MVAVEIWVTFSLPYFSYHLEYILIYINAHFWACSSKCEGTLVEVNSLFKRKNGEGFFTFPTFPSLPFQLFKAAWFYFYVCVFSWCSSKHTNLECWNILKGNFFSPEHSSTKKVYT